jgi:hypothetical protein
MFRPRIAREDDLLRTAVSDCGASRTLPYYAMPTISSDDVRSVVAAQPTLPPDP